MGLRPLFFQVKNLQVMCLSPCHLVNENSEMRTKGEGGIRFGLRLIIMPWGPVIQAGKERWTGGFRHGVHSDRKWDLRVKRKNEERPIIPGGIQGSLDPSRSNGRMAHGSQARMSRGRQVPKKTQRTKCPICLNYSEQGRASFRARYRRVNSDL